MADNKYIQPPNSVVFLFGDDQGNIYTVPSNEYSKADAAFRDSGREVVELERVVVNGEPTFRKHRDWLSNEERKLRDAEDEAFVAKGGSLKSGTPYVDLVADEPTLKFRDEDESGYQQNRKADYYRNEKALTEAFGEYDPDHEPSWLDVPKNIAKQTARVAVDATAGVALGLGHLVNSAGWLVTGAGHTRASEWFEDRIDKASRVSEAVREFSDSLDPYKDATTIPEAWRTAGDVAHQASVITTQMAMFSALNKGLKAPAPSAGGAVVPAGEVATGVGSQAAAGAGSQAATGVGSKVVALAGEAVKQTAPTMVLQGADVFGSTQAQAVNAGASVGEATVAATGAGLFAGATSVASYMLGGTFRGGSGFGSRVVNEMAEEASKAVGGRVSASVLANAFSNGDEAVKIFTVAMSKATPGVMRSVGRALVGAGIEGALGGSRTWVQMSLLQGAGVEISDADKWEAVQSSFLFSFAGAAATEVGAVYSNFRSLAKFRKQYAQNREQMARGARAQAQSQQPLLGDGSTGERSPAPVRVNDGRPGGVRVVEPNGDVRFADGTTVHANGSMTVANGAVVDRNGQLMTKGPATSDAGRETLDLFALIKGGDMRVYELPLDQVKVNDRIKQFKGDADAKTGVVQRLEGQYMPIPTKPILVMQFNDGSMEVVTGRHRYDLAKRNGMTVIPANVIRESDGWSVKMAQVMDAYDNILDEKGSDQDFVKFFRESKITDDEINDHRELVSRPRQKMARDVARYGCEELYSFVMDKHSLVTLDVAAAIAQNAPLGKSQWSTNIQRACIRGVLQDGMRAGEVAIYARGLQQAYNDRALKSQMAQLDLFGEDSTFDLSMRLQSKYASRKVGEIELDLSSFKQLVNKRGENLTAKKKLLEKYNLANDADTGAIQRVISDLEMQKKAWQNYHLDPALSREAKAYADKELHIAPVVVETESGEIQSLQQVEATLLQGDEALKKAEIEQSVSYGMSDAEGDLFALGEREGPTYEASVDAQIAADYDGVVQQYKGTDRWLKAPNGKPTNLTEKQWVQARTPSFKAWFGDWEALEIQKWLEGEHVASATGEEYKGVSKADIIDLVYNYWGNVNHSVNHDAIGTISLTKSSIRDTLAHGMGRKKISVLNTIPEIIKRGRLVAFRKNWKGRGYDSYILVAPVKIGEEQCVAFVVVNKNENSNRFYLHEVGVLEEIKKVAMAIRTGFSEKDSARSRNHGDIYNVAKSIYDVNQNNVSKIVDENGEPLVVYHGTNETFDVFDVNRVRPGAYGDGFYFATTPERARLFGDRVIPVFLNARANAREERALGIPRDYIKTSAGDYIVKDPNQVKHATENSGAFSGDANILRESQAQLDLFVDLPEQQRLFDINRYDGLSPEEAAVRQEEDARVDAVRPADEPDDVDLSKTWLRKLEPGEQCLVERRFTEDKAFSFTGGEKIASVEDVAYVFRSLEDEAVEHLFFGAVKDGKLHVVHVSMGKIDHTLIDPTVLNVMIRRLNPDKVYMIHNHPSGELTASGADVNSLKNLREQFGDVVAEEGIIIDQRSGSYATFKLNQIKENPGAHAVGLFNTSGEKRYTTVSPRRGADVPVKVFNFSKRVFNKDFSFKDFGVVASLRDVERAYFDHFAAMASAQRLSAADKLSVFVLNHADRIIGDFVVTGRDTFEVVDELSDYVASTGGSKVILFGRMDEGMFSRFAGDVSEAARGRVNIVDIVNFNEYAKSVSARRDGMMRRDGRMVSRPVHGDVLRENDPEPAFASQYRTGNFTDHVVSEPGQDVDLFGANDLPGLKSTFVPTEGAPGDQAPTVFTVEGVPGVMVRALDGAVEVRGLDQVVSQQQAAQVLDDLMQRDVRVVLDDASLLALGEKGRAMLEAHNGGLQDRARESVYPKDEADPAILEVNDVSMSPRKGDMPRSTLEVEVYPNGGRVPVAGSMAANASLLPLSLHHVVSMYRQLADGRSPAVVAQNNRGPRRGLGWFHIASKSVAVRAQLFGLVDASDLRILHDMLKKHGLFRHEDSTWCATTTKARQAMEKQISEARLERELNRLVDARIKRGQHTGVGTKVLAHELWHLIDALSEVKVPAKANLLDHMAMVKSAISQVQKHGALVTNARLVAEAEAFIPVWRGVDHLEEHFKDPSEMFAEMGAALMLDPKAVQAMAPTYYDVMLEGLKQHPKALDAWQAISDSIARGSDIDETLQTLAASWSREFEANVRKVRNEMTSRTKFDKKMETVYTFMDRYGPMVMVVERSQQAVKAKLKKDLEAGNISRALYDQEMKSLDAQLLDIKYQRALYTHQYGKSRLFLADLNEKVIEACRTLGVDFVDVNKYMHLKRVIELRDRATAHGIDAPMAHEALKAMAKAKGLAEMRKIVQVARTFRALYEQHVINNPSVREMLGPAAIKMMEENKHYVSMKHTVGSDELAHIERQRSAMADPEGGENPLDVALQNVFGLTVQSGGGGSSSGTGFTLKRLVGSFRATKSPVLATAQTAVAILEAAQKNHALIQLADALKKNKFVDFKLLAPGEKAPNNDRFGTVDFMRDGVKQTMIVPRVVADAFGVAPQMIGKLSIVSRFINAVFTTNNPTFPVTAYNRDLSALSINNPGLKRSALHFMSVLNFGAALSLFNVFPLVKPVVRTAQNLLNVGSYVPFVAQWIPPHLMDKMSKSMIGRLLFSEKTVEYWTSYGHKCAKIIQDMSFEATLQEAAEARARGNLAKAESLEYCVTMARHALEDGVLLTMTQMRKDNYNRSDLARLFDKYNLKYDDLETYGPMDNKIRKALRQLRANPTKALALSTWQLLQGLWNGAGYINEVSSMTVKLAGYCAFHHQRAKMSYDDSVDGSREVALQTVDRAGDPDFSRRGMVAHYLEVFISPFWNAKKEGFARTVRAAKANFSDWSGKMFMEGVLPRIMEFMISSGALAALLLKSCSKSGQPEELEGTAAGELYDFCEWNRAAMRNVSPYVRENYRVLPLWMSGDGSATVSLKLPIPTESAVAEKAVIAAWNMLDGGKASGRPMVGPMDVAGEFLQQFMPDFEQSGSIMGAVSPFIGMVMGYNPYSAYKQESFFTDEEYAARWTRPDAAIAALRNLWNYSPLVSVKRLRDTSKQGDIPEDMAVLKELLEAPLVGPYLARFMSVDSRGVEQTVHQFVREDKAKQAAMLLDVDQYIETWKKTGSIPKEVFSDIQMTDAFLKAMKKDIGKPDSFMRAWNKAMNIKSPEIRQKAIDYLNDRPKVD